MLTTLLCRQLGIDYPLFSAGMGGVIAGPALVAAVSHAGACGVLGMGALLAPSIQQQIQHVRRLTTKLFGVNLLLLLLQEGQIEVCLDEQIPILVLFWGDPTPYIEAAHRRGIKVFLQVGAVAEAKAAAAAGVDAIITQGVGAGGHARGTTALSILVSAVVEAVKPVPVIAACGIANGKGLVAALCLGAQAVSTGTRFLASEEAVASREYKGRVVQDVVREAEEVIAPLPQG
jgi:nitronate monooxygenase